MIDSTYPDGLPIHSFAGLSNSTQIFSWYDDQGNAVTLNPGDRIVVDNGVFTSGPQAGSTTPSSYYQSTVLADSPIAFYRFGESTGTAAADSSGNGNTATYTGVFTLGSPPLLGDSYGTAVAFSSSIGYVATAASAPFNFTGTTPFSLEAWVKPANITTTGQQLINHLNASTVGYLLQMSSLINGDLLIALNNVSGSNELYIITTAGVLAAGVPAHVVVTYDGTRTPAGLLIYINGVTVATTTKSNNLVSSIANAAVVAMGNYSPPGQAIASQFNGVMEEVAYYATVLSSARVLAHYNAGTFGTTNAYSNLVLASSPQSYWRLDEAGTTTVGMDRGTNANNGAYAGTYVLNNQPGALASDPAGSVEFTGVSGSQMLASNTGTPDYNGASFSAEVWVNTTVPQTNQGLLGATSHNGNGTLFQINLFGSTIAAVVFNTASGNATATSGTLSPNMWYYVAMTYNGVSQVVTLYINGVSVASATLTGTLVNGSRIAYVGSRNTAASTVSGFLQEAAIYNTLLSPATILSHYTEGTSPVTLSQVTVFYDNSGLGMFSTGNIIYQGTDIPVISFVRGNARGASGEFPTKTPGVWWSYGQTGGTISLIGRRLTT